MKTLITGGFFFILKLEIIKTTSKKIILISTALLLLCIMLVSAFFYIGYITYEYERWSPDISDELSDEEVLQILEKGESMTEEDYEILYGQTGLSRAGIERVIEEYGSDGILRFKDSYFWDYGIEIDSFSVFCSSAYIDGEAEMVPLKKGDVVVTSATNFSLWDTGHAALVVEEKPYRALEAYNFQNGSEICSTYELCTRPDFIVLRLKDDNGISEKIADYAVEELLGIRYDPTAGVLSAKNPKNLKRTQCAHIIWYAFMQFGIDIDSNGGLVVSPSDIAASEYFEVVQVFGFDPEKLW